MTAAQERLDMRSGCYAAKILSAGVRAWLSTRSFLFTALLAAQNWVEKADYDHVKLAELR